MITVPGLWANYAVYADSSFPSGSREFQCVPGRGRFRDQSPGKVLGIEPLTGFPADAISSTLSRALREEFSAACVTSRLWERAPGSWSLRLPSMRLFPFLALLCYPFPGIKHSCVYNNFWVWWVLLFIIESLCLREVERAPKHR